MKRKLSIILVTIILLQVVLPILTVIWESSFTNKSIAAEEVVVDGITWIYEAADGNAINVSPKNKESLPENVIIPNTLNGLSVTSIGYSAFDGCENLISITIPESVIGIEQWAFRKCNRLTSINIPEGVREISSWTFDGCYSLTNITIPEGVTSIKEGAFSFCSSLESIVIPDSVTSIGDYAFDHCRSLESITISEGVTSIRKGTFRNCESLTNITIPEGITRIEEHAFVNCYNLTSITIPDSVTSIGEYAFFYCSSLESITIPESVRSIGRYEFAYCSNLRNITIPNSVINIGENAFLECNSITIYCRNNSTAKEYAKINSINYKIVKLERLRIERNPIKTTYRIGENFDKEGMVVTAIYDNGEIREVTDYIETDGDDLTEGKEYVIISYTEDGVRANVTQDITVIPVLSKKLTKIEVKRTPIKTTYKVGESFDKAGMLVTAIYDNGERKEVIDYIVTDGENLTEGKANVTISYTENGIEKTTTQSINVTAVVEKKLSRIEITTPATKTTYKAGESFDKSGMVVTAIYDNGEKKEVKSYTVIDGDNLIEGQANVTIRYSENSVTKTVAQNINVTATVEKNLANIEITAAPEKTIYKEGQNFNRAGMVVTAIYDNGERIEVKDYIIMDGEYLTGGQASVTVRYSEKRSSENSTTKYSSRSEKISKHRNNNSPSKNSI